VPFKQRHQLDRHFVRHGEEFNVTTAEEYERLADAFLLGPLRQGAMECIRPRDGASLRFDPNTAEYGVLSEDGYVWTYMIWKPLPSSNQTALQYFQSDCKKV
jgi:pyocin large subunit-like protein